MNWYPAERAVFREPRPTKESADAFAPTSPTGNHVDDLDPIFFLDGLPTKSIASHWFAVALHQNRFCRQTEAFQEIRDS